MPKSNFPHKVVFQNPKMEVNNEYTRKNYYDATIHFKNFVISLF